MKVFGCLVVSCILCGVYGSQCIYDTMKCSRFWQARDSPWTFLWPRSYWVNKEELKDICRLQRDFFNCINEVANKSGEQIHPMFVQPKILWDTLCNEKSMLHKMYMNWSRCVNLQDASLDHCVPPETLRREAYFDGVREPDCKHRLQADKCIYTHFINHCSETAAWVYSLLNLMTNTIEYDKCENFSAFRFTTIPPPTDVKSTTLPSASTERLEQTTYETVNKDPSLRRAGDLPVKKKVGYKYIKPEVVYSIDEITSDPDIIQQLNTLYADNRKMDRSGEYVHIDPFAKWSKDVKITSGDDVTESKETSVLDYLENTSNPLQELENIIGDYIDSQLAEQNAANEV